MHDGKLKELAKKASSGDRDALGDFLLGVPRGSVLPGCEEEAAKNVSEKGMSVLVEVTGIPASPAAASGDALSLMKELHEQWEPESDEGEMYKDQLADAISKLEHDKEDSKEESDEDEDGSEDDGEY